MHPVSIWPNEYTRSVDIWYANKQHPKGKFLSVHIRNVNPSFALTPLFTFLWKSSLKVKRINGVSGLYNVFEPSTTASNLFSTRKKKSWTLVSL